MRADGIGAKRGHWRVAVGPADSGNSIVEEGVLKISNPGVAWLRTGWVLGMRGTWCCVRSICWMEQDYSHAQSRAPAKPCHGGELSEMGH